MTRADLMQSVIAVFGNSVRAAEQLGCSPSLVRHTAQGRKPVSTWLACAAVAALEDRADRIDRLATLMRADLAEARSPLRRHLNDTAQQGAVA